MWQLPCVRPGLLLPLLLATRPPARETDADGGAGDYADKAADDSADDDGDDDDDDGGGGGDDIGWLLGVFRCVSDVASASE